MGCKAAVGEQIQASEECSHSNKMAVPIYAAETAPTTIRGKSRDSSKELGSKHRKLV
jgi:hypothetical protein